jgi:hypothetical protein
MMRCCTVTIGLFAMTITLLAADLEAGADPPRPARSATTPPPRAGAAVVLSSPVNERRFDFEKRTSPVDEALTVLLGRERPMLPSAEEASATMARVASARRVVRANAKTATTAVLTEIEKLSNHDVEGHAELFSLLAIVADEDAAIETWSSQLTSGRPRPPRPLPERRKLTEPDQVRGQRSEREDPEALIRYLAIAHLYRAAREGSETAQAAILEAAASPHRDVRISAVQYTYALSRQRWKARQELEKRLPRSDQYMLYRY